jgi:hypothetical protein
MKKPVKTALLTVDGTSVSMPVELFERLGLLSGLASISMEEYVREILSEKYSKVVEWDTYPTETKILLSIYHFLFVDMQSTLKTLKSLNCAYK